MIAPALLSESSAVAIVTPPTLKTLLPLPIPRPRNHDWEAQYIRRRRNRYQARPYLRGVGRMYLGSFPTYHDARRAVVKFFKGEVKPLPKYVRAVFADGRLCAFAEDAEGYVGEIRTSRIQFRSRIFATREEAHAAAVAHFKATRPRRQKSDPSGEGDRKGRFDPAEVESPADLAAVLA